MNKLQATYNKVTETLKELESVKENTFFIGGVIETNTPDIEILLHWKDLYKSDNVHFMLLDQDINISELMDNLLYVVRMDKKLNELGNQLLLSDDDENFMIACYIDEILESFSNTQEKMLENNENI